VALGFQGQLPLAEMEFFEAKPYSDTCLIEL
jgi:hypothetical protein